MKLTGRHNGHRGSRACARCRIVVDCTDLLEVVKPGRKRGSWWCPQCVDALRLIVDG